MSTSVSELIQMRRHAIAASQTQARVARALMQGESRSRRRGQGLDFEEIRQYQPGDDIRSIDWRVSARTGFAHARVFASERELPVYLAVDQRANMFFGSGRVFKSVFAAQLASALAWHTWQNGERIGAHFADDQRCQTIPARRGRAALVQLLERLARCTEQLANQCSPNGHKAQPAQSVPANPSFSMPQWLHNCARTSQPGATLYLLSDWLDFDAQCQTALAELSHRFYPVLIVVRDPLENHWNISGQLVIGNVTGQRTTIHATRQFNKAWLAQIEKDNDRLAESVQRLGIPMIQATTDQSIGALVARCATPERRR